MALSSDINEAKLQFIGMPTLINEFPVMKFQPILSDNEFPPLDWIRFASKNMCQRFLEMSSRISERINFSRYSYIPVCNLDDDSPLFMIDTLYARTLAMNKHVLWYSDTTKPDLGGHEDKDFRIYF